MGMHIGLVAARTTVAQLRDAFSRAWTNFEIITSDDNLPDADAMWAWKEVHEQFVSAKDWTKDNPGREVYAFWQDGPWAVMMDPTYVLASDEKGLKVLSSQLGTVVSFVVETAGGMNDQGDMNLMLVEIHPMSPSSVLEQLFPMVRGDEQIRLVHDPGFVERPEERSQSVVHIVWNFSPTRLALCSFRLYTETRSAFLDSLIAWA